LIADSNSNVSPCGLPSVMFVLLKKRLKNFAFLLFYSIRNTLYFKYVIGKKNIFNSFFFLARLL